MGVIITVTGVQPACDDCGICLCWELSDIEYLEHPDYWDSWKCCTCNPNYRREYARKKMLLDLNTNL